MSQTLLVIIIAIIAVGLFVLAMSLTLLFKGHHIDSEIGDNKHMQKRGIKCAAQQIRDEDRALHGDDSCSPLSCSDANCGSCSTPHEAGAPQKQ